MLPRFIVGGLDDPRVVGLIETHRTRALAETARGSGHALDLSGLRAPGMTFWSAWQDERVVAVGALRQLDAGHGEIKSMYVAETERGRGVGSAMLRHIMAAARARGMTRLSLETGSWDYFVPARTLYARHGFVECGPFGDYKPDPNSIFMTLDLAKSW
jgi:putative acetyltransferase